ncbi:MAG: homing endonuclease [Parcubacteria group bacterium Licking1014_17]|nr:MAG: homing endonuclease [Parcubacteria group bacterium Licking1014_17]
MLLTATQKAILIGTMLGDGHLEQNGKGVRLKVDHGMAQKEYVLWKYEVFKNLVPSKPRVITSFHKKENKEYRRLHFSTCSNGIFQEWRDMFYKNRIKIVPDNIQEILIEPLSLAVWVMDDGYKRNDCNALRLNTDIFSYQEQQMLVDCLKMNFGIVAAIHKKGKTFNIYIPERSSQKFCEIIKPYILDSLLYKVSLTP